MECRLFLSPGKYQPVCSVCKIVPQRIVKNIFDP